jgi:hypothetical protein
MATGGLMLAAGCVVAPDGRVGLGLYVAPPVVYVPPPPPYYAPPPVYASAPVMVPDNYVWDGAEFVGDVNGQYFYLGPGNLWLPCGPDRLNFFFGWQRGHPDWRNHYIRNDRYRNDRNGHYQPRRKDDPHGH